MTNEWNAVAFGNADHLLQVAETLETLNRDAPLGPCQLQASPLCEGQAVMVRLDPMAMAPEDPAPVADIPTCQPCFDVRSDLFLAAARGVKL